MSLKHVFAAAAGFALLSGAAYAGDLATVKLAAPVTKETKVIADNAVFSCEGDTCTALTRTVTVRGCRAIADQAGVVVSYAADDKTLSADELAKCNAKVVAKAGDKTTVAAQ